MPVTVLYFDDQVDPDTRRLVERLQASGEIECELVPPPDELSVHEGEPPDVFVVDQDLSHVTAYAGSTLAEHIRQSIPGRPIILITRRSILADLSEQRRRYLTESLRVFDQLILKEEFENRIANIQDLVVSLAEGYGTLRDQGEKDWKSLVGILGAADEDDELRQATPPLSVEEKGRSTWTVEGAAYWIRHILLAYPGITYDSLHSATRLGLSLETFVTDEVQEIIEPSRYRGPFEGSEPKWWKSRLLKLSRRVALDAEIEGPINIAFPTALQEARGLSVEPPVCVWDGTPIADRVCYLLREPVKSEHSLGYFPDNRPAVMDTARISFRAIRESDHFSPDLLDEEGLSLIPKIESMEEPRGH